MDDFVTALQDIHRQFDWPYPIVSLSVAVSSQYAGNADGLLNIVLSCVCLREVRYNPPLSNN